MTGTWTQSRYRIQSNRPGDQLWKVRDQAAWTATSPNGEVLVLQLGLMDAKGHVGLAHV